MTAEELEYYNWLNKTTDNYRGLFVSMAIPIEQIIEEFLSWYFVGIDENKRIQFHTLIMGSIDMTFSQKIKMFTEIVNKFLPKEFDDAKKLLTKLDNIRHKRNDFAHGKADLRIDRVSIRIHIRDRLNLIKVKDYRIVESELLITELDKQLSDFDDVKESLALFLNKYVDSAKALSS
jgi:hypothetical protein